MKKRMYDKKKQGEHSRRTKRGMARAYGWAKFMAAEAEDLHHQRLLSAKRGESRKSQVRHVRGRWKGGGSRLRVARFLCDVHINH